MTTIKVKWARLPAPHRLHDGDSIEIGMSSSVKIDGDDNWLSYKVTTRVAEGETADQAHERALSYLHEQFQKMVYKTVDMIQAMGGQR